MQAPRKHLFWEYLGRLLREVWVWLTAVLTGLLGFIFETATGIPIALWAILPLLVIALMWASYRVYVRRVREDEAVQRRLRVELAQSQEKVRELEDRLPRFEVGFSGAEGISQQGRVIITNMFEPDLDFLVERKRQELLDKHAQFMETILETAPYLTILVNPNYEAEVGAFLTKYRDFLREGYEAWRVKERVEVLDLVVKYIGRQAADTIRLDFSLPPSISEAVPTPVEERRGPYCLTEPSVERNETDDLTGAFLTGLRRLRSHTNAERWRRKTLRFPEWIMNWIDFVAGPMQVTRTIDRLNPGEIVDRAVSLPLWLGDLDGGGTLEFLVKVTATQLPEPEYHRLSLVVRMEEPLPPPDLHKLLGEE